MERLGRRDLETSLAYLHGLYARRDPGDFRRHVLSTITELIPSELTTYNELDLRTSENVWEWEPVPPGVAKLAEAFAIHMDDNPCVTFFRRTGDGRATRISDFLSQRELRRLGYYSEYLKKVSLEHRMSVVVPKGSHAVIALALGRGGRDFSERDRAMLDLLRPHLAQAHDNASTLAQLRDDAVHPVPVEGAPLTEESFERLGLTRREAEVFAGVARGETNEGIAAALYVSPFTVKTHLQHIYRKLGVGSRTEALTRALQLL